jgi:hypothetical protein
MSDETLNQQITWPSAAHLLPIGPGAAAYWGQSAGPTTVAVRRSRSPARCCMALACLRWIQHPRAYSFT